MPGVIFLLALILSEPGDGQRELQSFNVSGIQCGNIARRVTPWDVQTDAKRYIDSCILWKGVVSNIIDADVDGTRAWVIPIEGRFAYCGGTLLKISFYGATGTDDRSSYRAFLDCDFLCAHRPSGIRRGDAVSFSGKVLGISRKPDPARKGHIIERVLIGITEINRIGLEREVRLPRDW